MSDILRFLPQFYSFDLNSCILLLNLPVLEHFFYSFTHLYSSKHDLNLILNDKLMAITIYDCYFIIVVIFVKGIYIRGVVA